MSDKAVRIVSPFSIERTLPERWGIARFGGGGGGAPAQQSPAQAMASAVPPAVGNGGPAMGLAQSMQQGIDPRAVMQSFFNAMNVPSPSMFQSPAFSPAAQQGLQQRGMNPFGVGSQLGNQLPTNPASTTPPAMAQAPSSPTLRMGGVDPAAGPMGPMGGNNGFSFMNPQMLQMFRQPGQQPPAGAFRGPFGMPSGIMPFGSNGAPFGGF